MIMSSYSALSFSQFLSFAYFPKVPSSLNRSHEIPACDERCDDETSRCIRQNHEYRAAEEHRYYAANTSICVPLHKRICHALIAISRFERMKSTQWIPYKCKSQRFRFYYKSVFGARSHCFGRLLLLSHHLIRKVRFLCRWNIAYLNRHAVYLLERLNSPIIFHICSIQTTPQTIATDI